MLDKPFERGTAIPRGEGKLVLGGEPVPDRRDDATHSLAEVSTLGVEVRQEATAESASVNVEVQRERRMAVRDVGANRDDCTRDVDGMVTLTDRRCVRLGVLGQHARHHLVRVRANLGRGQGPCRQRGNRPQHEMETGIHGHDPPR